MKISPLYNSFLFTSSFWVSCCRGSQDHFDYSKSLSYAIPLKNKVKITSLLSLFYVWILYRFYHHIRNKTYSKTTFNVLELFRLLIIIHLGLIHINKYYSLK